MDPEISTMKTRPSFSQRSEATRSAERIWPEHAKHLEPSCTQGSEFRGAVPIPLRSSRQEAPGEEIIALRGIDPLPPLTVYVSLGRSAEDDRHIADYLEQLPYMSWMKYGDYLLTKDPHKQLTREGYAERQRYYLADFGTPQAAATQTSYFQEFQQGYASGGDDNTIFNDRRDLKLVLDVADIIDELKMIEHLFSIQKEIIESSVKALGMDYLVSLNLMKETVDLLIHQITSISKDAEHTRKMLLNLLDLKSNAASLAEARSSAKEAQAATTQGRAVMLFTIITVVFVTALSFFTSYFGQNVKELTGDENNPTSWDLWRVATPITVVVIVVALLVAFYITRPKSPLWFWQAAPKQGAAVEQKPWLQARSALSGGRGDHRSPF
ncbi:unnamed protein product [Alternaria alternata]